MRLPHLSLSTSVLALSIAFCSLSLASDSEQPIQISQHRSDQLSQRLNEAARRAYSVRRKLVNLTEDLQIHGVDGNQIKPVIQKELDNLTKILTQMAVLEEKFAEKEDNLKELLTVAKKEKNKGLIEELTSVRSQTTKQVQTLTKHTQETRKLFSDIQSALAQEAPNRAENLISEIPSNLEAKIKSAAATSKPEGPTSKSIVEPISKPTTVASAPKNPPPIGTPPLGKDALEPTKIATTVKSSPTASSINNLPLNEAPAELSGVAKTQPLLTVSDTVPSNELEAEISIPPSKPKPKGNIPMETVATLPARVQSQKALMTSIPKEVSFEELHVDTMSTPPIKKSTSKSEDKLNARGDVASTSLEGNEKFATAEAETPTELETVQGNSRYASPFNPEIMPPVDTSIYTESAVDLTPADDEFGSQQALIASLPPLEKLEAGRLSQDDEPVVKGKKPLRTLGQAENPGEDLIIEPAFNEEAHAVENLEEVIPAPTPDGSSTHRSPALAVLNLDQGASAFKWYVFSAINRGLYKNPDMEFDIVEYSEDTTASRAKEVEGILLSLGLEPSQLHVKHAGADDKESRIHIYPAQTN